MFLICEVIVVMDDLAIDHESPRVATEPANFDLKHYSSLIYLIIIKFCFEQEIRSCTIKVYFLTRICVSTIRHYIKQTKKNLQFTLRLTHLLISMPFSSVNQYQFHSQWAVNLH